MCSKLEALLISAISPLILIQLVSGHGIMLDPVGRNSLWRVDQSAPVNYDDNELYCGGLGAIEQTGGKCGVCGDPYRSRLPRAHETGGHMVVNRTVKNYFPRSTIDVLIQLDTDHGGYFTFELCRRSSVHEIETEDCFERLNFADGSDKWRLALNNPQTGVKGFSLKLPEDLSDCPACILRWNYHAGNNWGVCNHNQNNQGHGHHHGGRVAGMGCGPQELYRNCADISIGYGYNSLNYPPQLREKADPSWAMDLKSIEALRSHKSEEEKERKSSFDSTETGTGGRLATVLNLNQVGEQTAATKLQL